MESGLGNRRYELKVSMNKELTAAQAISRIESGMTLGIGGWGPRRKPMALVRELLRSPIKDLTVDPSGTFHIAVTK